MYPFYPQLLFLMLYLIAELKMATDLVAEIYVLQNVGSLSGGWKGGFKTLAKILNSLIKSVILFLQIFIIS